ncbi:MAG: hypothetical protein AB7T22_11870 [Calditrichaceae bacterium]
MAKILLTLDEMVEIAKRNVKLPAQISNIKADGDSVDVTIDPGSLFPNISATATYDYFDDGEVHFNLETNGMIQILLKFIELPTEEWLKIDSDKITININKLLPKYINGVQVSDIKYSDGEFSVYTNGV